MANFRMAVGLAPSLPKTINKRVFSAFVMMGFSYDEIVARIKEVSNLSDAEIASTIDGKVGQFSGLVSKEGAAHILANELGIKLSRPVASRLKVANIVSGMQNVEVLGRVVAVYPAKAFSSNGRSGQVGSAIFGDETGTIRVVFWNEEANKLAFLKHGDMLMLKGVYVKDSRSNSLELHVNSRSLVVVNPPGESVEVKERELKRRRINELADDDSFVEVLATVIEVFDLRFFEVCPDCGKRARVQDSGFVCSSHGVVMPSYSYVLNAFLDDGTASVRTVFFRNSAQQFLRRSEDELLSFRLSPESFEQVKTEALGSFVKVRARVSRNEMYGRIELVANSVEPAKPEDAQGVQGVAQQERVEVSPVPAAAGGSGVSDGSGSGSVEESLGSESNN